MTTRPPVLATTLGDLALRAAERAPDAVALVCDDERRTGAEVLAGALRAAGALRVLGVEPGDRVAILAPNSLAYVDVLLGTALVGAVSVPVNARYRTSELAYVVTDAEPTVLVTAAADARVDFGALVGEALPGLGTARDPLDLDLPDAPRLRAVVGLDGDDWTATARRSDPAAVEALGPRVRLRDPAMLLYTSGTTAEPKGCVLSHELLVRTAIAQAERWAITPADVYWAPLPLFHMAGLLPLMASLWTGARLLTAAAFVADAELDRIERERASILFACFPAISGPLVHHPRFGAADLSAVRLVNHGAPEALQRELQRAFPQAQQVQSYGCTELGGVCAACGPGDPDDACATTGGRPWPGMELRVVDPATGADVPTGERGEIVARGFGRFDGYWRRPEETARAIDDDGWFHTGDVGSLDGAGRIAFHGRFKDMLKVGGENVGVLEVESFLMTHPDVVLAQVVGVPDERLGEVVAAFLELRDGAQALDLDAVVAFCRGRIASFKIPRHVEVVADWPMSSTKVQKFRLRDRLVRA